jgi:hypothetical protein
MAGKDIGNGLGITWCRPRIGQKFLGHDLYFGSRKKGRGTYFSEIIERAKIMDKAIWVTELQAEPYEPSPCV